MQDAFPAVTEPARAPRWASLVRLFLTAGLVTLLGVAVFTGCDSGCDGVKIDGVCQTTCRDDLCADGAEGAKCFDNACRPPCTSNDECPSGEKCRAAVTDYGTRGNFCVGTPKPTPGTTGEPCKKSDDCQSKYGYRCIDEACTLTCDLHSQCGAAGSCTGEAKDAEGNAVHTCAKDAFMHGQGQYGSACPNVAGADGGTAAGCDATNDFTCLGQGAGDADAYCTQRFCGTDDDCPSGFFCASDRASEQPCEDSCGLTGSPADPRCVTAADIGKGKHFSCGAVSLVVNTCRHRTFCDACKTDADCAGEPNQVCAADQSGEKICTVLCDANLNSCPWGSAAVCGKWDTERGVATCAHRAGSCHAKGEGCEPCRDETDCPGGTCQEAMFTGERYCIDLRAKCSCPSGTQQSCLNGGCPKSPSGAPLNCLGGDLYKMSVTYDVCFGANTDQGQAASREGCWPSL